ncbi:MAG: hypothetical protein HQL27_06270 [Candidatus Omnitrophica bacterium]|nr:hypothetical protein [Candidatus Omnitrophota bacterium]
MANFFIHTLKIIFAILLIPVVIASAVVFYKHLLLYPAGYGEFFIWGALSFLLAFLFIYQFWGVHEIGQKAGRGVFKILTPAEVVLARMFPFYLLVVLIVFLVTKKFFRFDSADHYFMYFTGFIFAMNILLVAQELQEEETAAFKPNYFFWMGLTFTINIIITILLLDFITGKMTFMRYFWSMVDEAKKIYNMILSIKFSVKISK